MAGLGRNVGTNFSLRSLMMGSIDIGGQTLQGWFFTDGSGMFGSGFMGDRDVPSAHIEPIQGELITINYTNQSMMAHTIHLHGLDVDQANDGVPLTSFEVPPMGTATYQFTAPHAGTYHYHCHVDTVLHYARGMFGAVIVRPPDGSTNKAWDGGPVFDEEVLWQLSTIDSSWFTLQESSSATARHRPDAFLINGFETERARSDSYTRIAARVGQRVYLRIVHSGYQWARVSLGGIPFDIVASDGRPMRQVQRATSIEIGPGERYDLYFTPSQPGQSLATVDYLDDYTGAILGSVSTEIEIT